MTPEIQCSVVSKKCHNPSENSPAGCRRRRAAGARAALRPAARATARGLGALLNFGVTSPVDHFRSTNESEIHTSTFPNRLLTKCGQKANLKNEHFERRVRDAYHLHKIEIPHFKTIFQLCFQMSNYAASPIASSREGEALRLALGAHSPMVLS